jgi:hypothetical protein
LSDGKKLCLIVICFNTRLTVATSIYIKIIVYKITKNAVEMGSRLDCTFIPFFSQYKIILYSIIAVMSGFIYSIFFVTVDLRKLILALQVPNFEC